jgi:hypothetical protein
MFDHTVDADGLYAFTVEELISRLEQSLACTGGWMPHRNSPAASR